MAIVEDAFAINNHCAQTREYGGMMHEILAALISAVATSLLIDLIHWNKGLLWLGRDEREARSAEDRLQPLVDHHKYHAFEFLCEYVDINAKGRQLRVKRP
jgi:hypothetical protein